MSVSSIALPAHRDGLRRSVAGGTTHRGPAPEVAGEKPGVYNLQVHIPHLGQDHRPRLFDGGEGALNYVRLMPLHIDLDEIYIGQSKLIKRPNSLRQK